MKKALLSVILTLLTIVSAQAAGAIRPYNSTTGEKGLYKPNQWTLDSSTGEYYYDGVSYNVNRSRESENFVVYWSSEYGSTAPDKLSTSDFYYVNIDYLLQQAEVFYKLYSETLAFVDPTKSTTMSKYKCMICLIHTTEWMAFGGGYDYVVPALWINPSTCKPIGHTVAHEVGHSFHYMCYSEHANHQNSYSDNTGFHLACGSGQAIWEQTAQWQGNNAYPSEMFGQSYPLFGNNANYAFSHEWMRYQSYWFHYYICDYYNDLTTVAQVWNQPMTGQTDRYASDFLTAFMKLKNLTAEEFFKLYHDYAMHCAVYDFSAAKNYRRNYIGRFDYHAVPLGDETYQVSYASAPQCSGFNVIELNLPTTSTTITTRLTGLVPGSKLINGDPGVYNNGNANSLVSADVTTYNTVDKPSIRGFRVGYVFYQSDGTATYYTDNKVHCTGTGEVTEDITATMPYTTSRIFLVITPALTEYVCHRWDDNIKNDDQWPYRFRLIGTTAKSVAPDFPEPEFEPVFDGRKVSDVTLTYTVVIPPANDYSGASVSFKGSSMNALCTAFQIKNGSDIFNNVLNYSSDQSKGTIMNYPINANGTLQYLGKTTEGDFGHWFNASGTAVSYGSGSLVYAQFSRSGQNAIIGQYPNGNSNGTKRTIREALRYIDNEGNVAIARLVFNITFQTGATAYAYLSDIDYVEPGINAIKTNVDYLTTVMEAETYVVPGESNLYVQSDDDGTAFRNALRNVSLRYFANNMFKGYHNPLSELPSTGLYYYAIDGAPQFNVEPNADGTTSGTVAFYNVPSVTDDPYFDGQYTYYYDAEGQITDKADEAKIILAFDNTTRTYNVKTTADCPLGTYTLWFGVARKVNYLYFAAYSLTINVVDKLPTGIETIENGQLVIGNSHDVYDLQGRPVADNSLLPKGLYIINGKKVLVR